MPVALSQTAVSCGAGRLKTVIAVAAMPMATDSNVACIRLNVTGNSTSRLPQNIDLTPSEIEGWVDDAKRGMENALRAKPEDVREQYERQLKDLQEAYGEAMLELRARKKLTSLLGKDET